MLEELRLLTLALELITQEPEVQLVVGDDEVITINSLPTVEAGNNISYSAGSISLNATTSGSFGSAGDFYTETFNDDNGNGW